MITACPPHSVLAEQAAGRDSTVLPTQTDDTLAVAAVMLQALHRLGVGPQVDADGVAQVLDDGEGDTGAADAMIAGFPTCAVATFAITGDWAEQQVGGARLSGVHVARANG